MEILKDKNIKRIFNISNENRTINICDIYSSVEIDIEINLMENSKVNLNINSIAYGSISKKIRIYVNHIGFKTESSLNALGITFDTSKIDVKLYSKVMDVKGTVVHQNIKGIIYSKESSIKGEPILLISEKDSKVSHSLSIGKIDDEILFYLMCKNLTREEIINMIIFSNFSSLFTELESEKKSLILKKIKDIINEHK